MPNKSYVYLLNIEPSNLVFLRFKNTEFDEIIKKPRDQNSKPLEIENKVDLKLLINKYKCDDVLQSREQENVLKDMDFYHLQENIKDNYWIRG